MRLPVISKPLTALPDPKLTPEQQGFSCRILRRDELDWTGNGWEPCILIARKADPAKPEHLIAYLPADTCQPCEFCYGDAREKLPTSILFKQEKVRELLEDSTYVEPFLVISQSEPLLKNFFKDIQTNEVQNWVDKIYPFNPELRKASLMPGYVPEYDPFDL